MDAVVKAFCWPKMSFYAHCIYYTSWGHVPRVVDGIWFVVFFFSHGARLYKDQKEGMLIDTWWDSVKMQQCVELTLQQRLCRVYFVHCTASRAMFLSFVFGELYKLVMSHSLSLSLSLLHGHISQSLCVLFESECFVLWRPLEWRGPHCSAFMIHFIALLKKKI